MGHLEHAAYVKLREAQEKAERNPYFSDLKEKVKDAEINHLKAQLEERENDKLSKEIWGF